jgi:hypothetical protein
MMEPPCSTTGFTQSEYRVLLEKTMAQYACVGFEVLDSQILPDRFAIIRHDIDISPTYALALAKLEASLDIRATFTILLTGEFYSPFEASTRDVLREISSLGHDIGLHFDSAWHQINSEEQLEEAIQWETETLNRLLRLNDDQQVQMFSFHNTTPFTMSCKQSHYAGLRNAYAGLLQDNLQYISDSNGYWIYRSWDKLLNEGHNRIQVLTHPVWWRQIDAEPAEKVCCELEDRSKRLWVTYRRLLEGGGRVNRTGLLNAAQLLPELYELEGEQLLRCWLDGRREQAYVELYCRFERQLRRLVRRCCRTLLRASANQVHTLFNDYKLQLDPLRFLRCVAGVSAMQLLGINKAQYRSLKNYRNGLVHGFASFSKENLSRSIDRLCLAIDYLDRWAKQHPIGVAGTRRLTTADMPLKETAHQKALPLWLKANRDKLQLSESALDSFFSRHPKIFMEFTRL